MSRVENQVFLDQPPAEFEEKLELLAKDEATDTSGRAWERGDDWELGYVQDDRMGHTVEWG